MILFYRNTVKKAAYAIMQKDFKSATNTVVDTFLKEIQKLKDPNIIYH